MTTNSSTGPEPRTDASSADVAEQSIPADPVDEADDAVPAPPERPVSEADWLDQTRAVPLEDDRDEPAE